MWDFLKTIKWCRLFSQWELQIGSRQLCLIYIFQSGKKSRLISLTDSGCLGYFLFIKVKLPSLASGVPSDGLSFKILLMKKANSCLKPGETSRGAWPGLDAGGSCGRSFPQLSTGSVLLLSLIFHAVMDSANFSSSERVFNKSHSRCNKSAVCGAWREAGPLGSGAIIAVSWGRTGGLGCPRCLEGCGQLPSPGRGSGSGCCCPPAALSSSGRSGTIIEP